MCRQIRVAELVQADWKGMVTTRYSSPGLYGNLWVYSTLYLDQNELQQEKKKRLHWVSLGQLTKHWKNIAWCFFSIQQSTIEHHLKLVSCNCMILCSTQLPHDCPIVNWCVSRCSGVPNKLSLYFQELIL